MGLVDELGRMIEGMKMRSLLTTAVFQRQAEVS